MNKSIIVKGAKEHNLKNIDIEIPRNAMTVITGVSGSGKSSLAFNTIYAEAHRRYIESLSSYARQFLDDLDKPDVKEIHGLSPAISIEQKSVQKNPRSTVGTVTEIYDYLRLLFSKVGTKYCPNCNIEIKSQTPREIIKDILEKYKGQKIILLSPIINGKKGTHEKVFDDLKMSGFVRVRVDGEIKRLDEEIKLQRYVIHYIDIVIDRLTVGEDEQRLTDSIETALKTSNGQMKILFNDGEIIYSENSACPKCNKSIEELSPRMFSFNSPHGACSNCHGLGEIYEFSEKLLVDEDRSLEEGAILPFNTQMKRHYLRQLRDLGRSLGFNLSTKYKDLSELHKNAILYGTEKETLFSSIEYEGVIPTMRRRYNDTDDADYKEKLRNYMKGLKCRECDGKRLKKEVLAVKINNKNIHEVTEMSIKDSHNFFKSLVFDRTKQQIADPITKEITERLKFLVEVGLSYLTLNRSAATLSGGESQRIRLATQIGSALTGVLYVLDEPSIGLHQRDNQQLINILKRLRDLGNTILVVEHDEDTIRSSDRLIDMGPGAGIFGGEVVANCIPNEITNIENSLTGQYITGKRKIEIPQRRSQDHGNLVLENCNSNNLKNVTLNIPLKNLVCITGVSGSGKSTLINQTLYPVLANKLNRAKLDEGIHSGIKNWKQLDKVINIDQSPIGRSPRSNPATYIKVFDDIRSLFASLPESKVRGYSQGRFSFNIKGGRCENCQGNGTITVEMHFMSDVYVKCDKCDGKRYNKDTLEVKYKGKSISDILDMTVAEAEEFFDSIPKIKQKLMVMNEVGLDYLKLGQPATTLSGGEAQRIKLTKELSRRSNKNTIYILDEPTTGLHFEDIKKLIKVLQSLVDKGSTVIVIEHNLDVIKCADWITDLGPEGGYLGGEIIAEGTPEDIIKVEKSHTGRFLKNMLSDKNAERISQPSPA